MMDAAIKPLEYGKPVPCRSCTQIGSPVVTGQTPVEGITPPFLFDAGNPSPTLHRASALAPP